MDAVYTTDILSRYQEVPRHRLTRRDYHRMAEAGILGEDDRVELLEGQLIEMASIGPRHALAVDALTEMLVLAAARVKPSSACRTRWCWTIFPNRNRISLCCAGRGTAIRTIIPRQPTSIC